MLFSLYNFIFYSAFRSVLFLLDYFHSLNKWPWGSIFLPWYSVSLPLRQCDWIGYFPYSLLALKLHGSVSPWIAQFKDNWLVFSGTPGFLISTFWGTVWNRIFQLNLVGLSTIFYTHGYIIWSFLVAKCVLTVNYNTHH